MREMLALWRERLVFLFAMRAVGGLWLTLALAFGVHALMFPDRLPPVSTLGLIDLGLLDPSAAAPFDADAAARAKESAQEAIREGKPYIEQWLSAHPTALPWINRAAALLAAALLAASMWVRTRREPAIGAER